MSIVSIKQLQRVIDDLENTKRGFEEMRASPDLPLLRLHGSIVLLISSCEFMLDNVRVIKQALAE